MAETFQIISSVSCDDKAKFVSLLKSKNYREVGILETPGESEYSVRSHISNFGSEDCDCGKEWTIIYGARRDT